MKRICSFILAVCALTFALSIVAYAASPEVCRSASVAPLRAGGGGSSGGGGGSSSGGGGSSGSSSHSSHNNGRGSSPLSSIVSFILMPIFIFSSSIVFYIQLTKRSRKAKRLMKQMRQGDSAWKYHDISAQVEEGFLAIQQAWTNMDMSTAAPYMSDELLDSFQTKLNWMAYKNQQNILKKIQLIKALPVAVHDDADNSHDFIWFYIKGRMIDYTVDTGTHEMIDGSTGATSFVEYWKFIRRENKWVLDQILQKDEQDEIPFVE